jgi:hypothetical protein
MVETEKKETQPGQDYPEGLTASDAEAKRLLQGIRVEIDGLRGAILTEGERKEIKQIQEDFDRKMQEAVYATRNNLNSYRLDGWRQLIYEGDEDDERTEPEE